MAITPASLSAALMKGADTDGSGGLSVSEFRKLAPIVTGTANPTAAQMAEAFKTLDADGNRQLSADELGRATFVSAGLAPAAQKSVLAYQSIIQAGTAPAAKSITDRYSFASALYGSLNPTDSRGALTATLLAASLTGRKLLV